MRIFIGWGGGDVRRPIKNLNERSFRNVVLFEFVQNTTFKNLKTFMWIFLYFKCFNKSHYHPINVWSATDAIVHLISFQLL